MSRMQGEDLLSRLLILYRPPKGYTILLMKSFTRALKERNFLLDIFFRDEHYESNLLLKIC